MYNKKPFKEKAYVVDLNPDSETYRTEAEIALLKEQDQESYDELPAYLTNRQFKQLVDADKLCYEYFATEDDENNADGDITREEAESGIKVEVSTPVDEYEMTEDDLNEVDEDNIPSGVTE